MRKIYLNSPKDFIDWKAFNDYDYGQLPPSAYEEKKPLSYPCVLIEVPAVNAFGDTENKYGFVYLTDFIVTDLKY